MSDIHPLSGSSYPEMAISNPLDVNNHPDTIMPSADQIQQGYNYMKGMMNTNQQESARVGQYETEKAYTAARKKTGLDK